MVELNQLPVLTNSKYQTLVYNVNGIAKQKNVFPDSSLFWLSEKILEWYYNDELGIIIVHGQQGYGKSTYASISCAEVYGHDQKTSSSFYDWKAAFNHMVWTPRQFIELSRKKGQGPDGSNKERMIVWDDAGYWLNAMDYRDKLCIAVSKFLELARTRWGAIVFTCSHQSQILSKIRSIPHAWSVPISKFATPSRNNLDYRSKKDLRFARLHKSWTSEDLKKSGKKGKEGDIFYARMPGTYNTKKPDWRGWEVPRDKKFVDTWGFYGKYKPWRDTFCERGLDELDQAAKDSGL